MSLFLTIFILLILALLIYFRDSMSSDDIVNLRYKMYALRRSRNRYNKNSENWKSLNENLKKTEEEYLSKMGKNNLRWYK